jgi:hypothetical protein
MSCLARHRDATESSIAVIMNPGQVVVVQNPATNGGFGLVGRPKFDSRQFILVVRDAKSAN